MKRSIKENFPVVGAMTVAASLIVGAVCVVENPNSFSLPPSVHCDNGSNSFGNEQGSELVLGSRNVVDGTGAATAPSSDYEQPAPLTAPGNAAGAIACQNSLVILYRR